MAALSAEDPDLPFTVRRTLFTHLQNRLAKELRRVFAISIAVAYNLSLPFRDAG